MSSFQRSLAGRRSAEFRIWCRESGTEPTRELRAGFYAGYAVAYTERERLCQDYRAEIERLTEIADRRFTA